MTLDYSTWADPKRLQAAHLNDVAQRQHEDRTTEWQHASDEHRRRHIDDLRWWGTLTEDDQAWIVEALDGLSGDLLGQHDLSITGVDPQAYCVVARLGRHGLRGQSLYVRVALDVPNRRVVLVDEEYSDRTPIPVTAAA